MLLGRPFTASPMLLLPFLLVCLLGALREATASLGFTMAQGFPEGTYIHFNQVPTNLQADITKELGAFRCSQPGLFYFTFAAMAPTRGSYRISLRKNRVPVVTAFASDTGFSWASNSAVLYLAQNDLVYLYLEDGTIHESTASNRAFTTFSGFQIGSDMLLGRNPELVDAAEGQLSPPDPFDDIFARMAYYETPRNASEASD